MRDITHLDSGWKFSGGTLLQPLPAIVPGHVHLDLLRNGVIPDPFLHTYEAGVQWVDETDWTYTTNFQFTSNSNLPLTELHFNGLDTIATIELNGVKVGSSNNMFVPCAIDISNEVKQGENNLTVHLESPVRIGKERQKAYFDTEGINFKVKNFDERAFLRKAPYMSGWDWGPRLVSCGIWKGVELIQRTADDLISDPVAKSPLATLNNANGGFQFEQNGKKLWIRGANWIPNHSFPALCNRPQLRDTLLRAKDMNFNMLRIWGGGLYETDDFYELCAELDILVWQDFLFACSYYPEDDGFLKNVEIEAITAIKRLRQYPNLVLWCGNNENHSMWFDGWQSGEEKPSRYYGQKIYEELLPGLVKGYDPERAYIASSPIGGASPNGDSEGDVHCWDVWHGRGDWRFYGESKTRFCSEFGFASCPTLATWKETLGTTDLRHDDPAVRAHDKTLKPYNLFTSMVELHYPASESLVDWTYRSQLNQRDAMKFGIEHYRRGDFCSGTLIWQLNDCWPVQSWAILDHANRQKAVAYDLKRIYADFLLSLERQGETIHLHAVNDGVAQLTVPVVIEARDTVSGELLMSWNVTANLNSGERKVILDIPLSGLNTSRTIVVAKAGESTTWTLLVDPKTATFAEPLPIVTSTNGEVLNLTLSAPVVDLMLTIEVAGGGGDPSPFVTNFITAAEPGQVTILLTKHVDVTTVKARSLSGHHIVRF